jgi:hypothetical protein
LTNKSLLKQARNGLKRLINESPEIILIYRKKLVDDGFNGCVEDPFDSGCPPDEIKCRLSHEQSGPDKLQNAPSGLSTNLLRYITVDHKTTIYEGDTFESEKTRKRYKIGAVDPLIKFGGVYGYQAPLVEAETLSA